MSVDSTSSPPAAQSPAQPPRSRWQFSLRMILLLMAAVGVWTAEIVNRYTIAGLEKRVAAMRPLARELEVKDRSQIAVVKLEEEWYDANEWRMHLPPGEYQLCLATQEIPSQGFPPQKLVVPLVGGEIELSLLQPKFPDGHRVQVVLNGDVVLTADEPLSWQTSGGSSGGGHFSISEQLDPSQPVILFRRRFDQPSGPSSSRTPMEPCNGLMLWIERVGKE